MPKLTPFKLMSKADQLAYLKAHHHKSAAMPRVRAVGQAGGEKAGPARMPAEPRDGLLWLVKKKRLNAAEAREAGLYRRGFREDGEGVLGSPVCTEGGMGGGCGGGGGKEAVVVAMTDARREYLLIVSTVFRGVPDLRTAMDGVCGRGYTLMQLAGGKQLRAVELENALKIALNLIIGWRAARAEKAA